MLKTIGQRAHGLLDNHRRAPQQRPCMRMSSYTRIKDVRTQNKAGESVTLKGWIVTDTATVDRLGLSTGSSLSATGKLVEAPGGSTLELHPTEIVKIGECDVSFPMSKKRHSLEFLRDVAHLRSRGNTIGAVMRVRNSAMMAVHNFFQKEGFIQVHTPIISANDCEGAGELFMISSKEVVPEAGQPATPKPTGPWNDFFGVPEAYLTVSGQLQAEIFATSMGKVYTFGPTFRAENSNTPRHLAEFWMIEPEIAFCDLDGVIDVSERFIKSVIADVLANSKEDLDFFAKWTDTTLLDRLKDTMEKPFVRVTYTDAIELLNKAKYNIEWGADLERQHERYLCEEHFAAPVFVTDWPVSVKPFYMLPNADGKTVACMDLLIPKIGEVIGGSAREDDYERLVNRMKALNMNIEPNQWYLDLRKYGTVPHAGFGLGFERLLLYLTGMENIRDVIPIPRHPNYCKF